MKIKDKYKYYITNDEISNGEWIEKSGKYVGEVIDFLADNVGDITNCTIDSNPNAKDSHLVKATITLVCKKIERNIK